MSLSAKPTAYTVNTGHAKCPDHLYMLDDSTGGTNCNDGVGSLDLTIDSTGMWNTDGTYGQILRFVSASSQKALSGNTFSAASGLCIVVITKTASATNPAAGQTAAGVGHGSTSGIRGGLEFDTSGYPRASLDTSGSTNVTRIATDHYDGSWHLWAVKFNDTTGTDSVEALSLDGAAWTGTGISGSGDGDLGLLNRIALGVEPSATPAQFFDGDILAAYVYVDDYSTWDDAWIASLYSDPWQFLSTAVTYVKLLAEASAASAASIEGVVLNSARDTVIGEFTGQTFEASLEGGEAVLLIDVADITPNGSTLTTSDTPLVFAYNATDSIIGPGSATVVEL